MSRDMNFYHWHEIYARNIKNNYWILLQKSASKSVVHKSAEATGEFTGNKILEKIVKSKPIIEANSRNVEEIVQTRNTKLIKTSIINII